MFNDQRPFTDEDRTIINSYRAVVDGVSALIGSHCEIVLHSLENLEHSAIYIANGHNTNRQEGSPITDRALQSLHNMKTDSVSKPYFTRAKSNGLMKSVTIAIRRLKKSLQIVMSPTITRIVKLLCRYLKKVFLILKMRLI